MHKKYIYSIDIYGIWNLNENENDELTLKLISIIMQSSIWGKLFIQLNNR